MDSEELPFDVVIVGAGPAGLAAAIELKRRSPELSVVVLEKGVEVGAHIVSGAVIDPAALDELVPDWRDDSAAPGGTPVSEDEMLYLTASKAVRLPKALMPPLMHNAGNIILSLGDLCRWLAAKAEALGVEIYPGFPAASLLIRDGRVAGVVTGDAGLERDGSPGANYSPGVHVTGQFTLLAEGARGSLTRQAMAQFHLGAGAQPQKFGLGFKEIWEIDPAKHVAGRVQHGFGWPLSNDVGGGFYLYHQAGNRIAIGLVIHLDYANPYLSPFEEFQRLKTHPMISALLEGGKRLGYGARAIAEGGLQSIPKLAFPGGALIGDSAGLVNLARIKGTHNAIRSGQLAAIHVAEAITANHDNLADFDRALRDGKVGQDLALVRNVKPLWSRLGTFGGMLLGGADMWSRHLLGWSPLGQLGHSKPDYASTQPAERFRPIEYPRPDNILTFDRLSSIYLSSVGHREDQPSHLRVGDMDLQVREEFGRYAGLSARYCPAGVYEWQNTGQYPVLQINAANCIHCKTCDIKDPAQNITWTPPEGGGGPIYGQM